MTKHELTPEPDGPAGAFGAGDAGGFGAGLDGDGSDGDGLGADEPNGGGDVEAPGRPSSRAPRVLVEGRGGLLDGVKIPLRTGVPLAVGRSRSCDLSFRKAPGFARRGDKEKFLRSPEFNRLSRIHCEMTLLGDGRVEVRDLSHNGTWVEGDRVHGSVVVDLRHGVVHVDPLLGAFGSMVLRGE